MKFYMVGALQMVVLRFEFHQNRLSGFRAVGGRNLPIPIDLAIGLYNSLYYRTSRDVDVAKYLHIRFSVLQTLAASSLNCCAYLSVGLHFIVYILCVQYLCFAGSREQS